MHVAGPSLDQYATPEVWKAFRDLCSRRGIDFHQCQREIIASRVRAQQLDTQEKSRIRADLLTYLRETIDDRPDTPALDTARTAVFSISLTSSFVESLFSKMEYNQSKVRSRMSASTTAVCRRYSMYMMPTCLIRETRWMVPFVSRHVLHQREKRKRRGSG